MAILKMSLSASIFILVIVIIRAFTIHKLPKKTFLVLWSVALCRLLIPLSIPSRFSVYTVVDMLKNKFLAADTSFMGTAAPNFGMTAGAISPTLVKTADVSVSYIMVIWISGLSICALFFLVTHLQCRREYKTALPIENELVRQWLSAHPTRRNVQIRQSDKIAAPLTYGIFRPVVLLPKETDWTDETRLRYILTHEHVHIRHFDALTKLLLATALCVHWINPLVWVMYVLANRDIELSCDEMVVRTFGETTKSAYALTLIGLEEKRSRRTPLVNNFSKNAIEERIVSIMKIKKTSLMRILLAFVLVFSTAIVFATSAVASAAADSKDQSVENEDTVIHYLTHGTPGNHSGYAEADYETLMELKTDNYRQMTTREFLDNMKQNNIDTVYGGYNPNDENVDFLKTLQYSFAELIAEWDAEYGYAPSKPGVSISTASNKKNADGVYYGAKLDFTIFWTGTEQLTVGERDDTLNAALEQIQQILEQKTKKQIGIIEDLNADYQKVAEQISNSKIKVTIQIDEYKVVS